MAPMTGTAHQPNNLIVQLSGSDFQGSPAYEVVASGLRIPTGKPYYIAASLDNHPAPGQNFGGTITFYIRDLSEPNAEMQTITVSHQIVGSYINKDRALYVGGREIDKSAHAAAEPGPTRNSRSGHLYGQAHHHRHRCAPSRASRS